MDRRVPKQNEVAKVYLIKFIYTALLFPPGLYIIGLLGLAYWSYRRNRAVAGWIFALALAVYISSTGLVANAVIHSLEDRYSPPPEIAGDVIIVLGGGATLDTPNVDGLGHVFGNSANRLITAVRLYRQLDVPIIVSGGKVLATTGVEADIAKMIMKGLGVPDSKIIPENTSLNTTQNAENCARLLQQQGFRHPVLVTSAFHMERAVWQFQKVGVTVVPYPTDYLTNVAYTITVRDFWPSANALDMLTLGLKEYLGIAAIRWY